MRSYRLNISPLRKFSQGQPSTLSHKQNQNNQEEEFQRKTFLKPSSPDEINIFDINKISKEYQNRNSHSNNDHFKPYLISSKCHRTNKKTQEYIKNHHPKLFELREINLQKLQALTQFSRKDSNKSKNKDQWRDLFEKKKYQTVQLELKNQRSRDFLIKINTHSKEINIQNKTKMKENSQDECTQMKEKQRRNILHSRFKMECQFMKSRRSKGHSYKSVELYQNPQSASNATDNEQKPQKQPNYTANGSYFSLQKTIAVFGKKNVLHSAANRKIQTAYLSNQSNSPSSLYVSSRQNQTTDRIKKGRSKKCIVNPISLLANGLMMYNSNIAENIQDCNPWNHSQQKQEETNLMHEVDLIKNEDSTNINKE